MIYLCLLVAWLAIACFAEIINAINTYRYKGAGEQLFHVFAVLVRYAVWGWLIYKVTLIF